MSRLSNCLAIEVFAFPGLRLQKVVNTGDRQETKESDRSSCSKSRLATGTLLNLDTSLHLAVMIQLGQERIVRARERGSSRDKICFGGKVIDMLSN